MRGEVIITATMADGSAITEIARTFAAFTALVLAFRADPDCRRLTWTADALSAPPNGAVATATVTGAPQAMPATHVA